MPTAISLNNLSYSISGIDILRSLDLEITGQSYFAHSAFCPDTYYRILLNVINSMS